MASTATILPSSRVTELWPSSQRKTIDATIVADGTDGAAATPILASVFGLKFIEQCSSLEKSDDSVQIPANPNFAGTGLITCPTTHATPANLPAGTYNIVLEGY